MSKSEIPSILKTAQRSLRLLDRPARVQLSFLMVAIILGTGLEAIGLSTIFPLLQYIVAPEQLNDQHILSQLAAYLPGDLGDKNFAFLALIAMASAFVLKNLILLGVTYAQFAVVYNNILRVACLLFESYLRRPYGELLDRNSADLIRNVREVVSFAFKNVVLGFINAAIEALMIITILALMIYIEPYSAVIACAIIIPGAALYLMITRTTLHRLGHEDLIYTTAILKAIQEGLHSLKQTKVFGRELYFGKAFRAAQDKAMRIAIISGTISQTPRLWFESLVIIAAVAIVMLLLITTSADSVAPTLGLFAIAMLRMIPSANRLSLAINNIRNGAAALSVLEAELNDTDSENHSDALRPDRAVLGPVRKVELDNVEFIYPASSIPSLNGINLTIVAGEITALIGPSGSGKTTTVDILLSLLSPTSGNVKVNGINVSDVIGQWRNCLAYVPQQVYVSDDTLRRNVAFALPDKDIDDARVIQALRDAKLDHLLDDIPGGLSATLGENGRQLSIGQQQRIGIARALYEQPEFLVLDEATSALDVEVEQEIVSVLENLRDSLTIIVIAHRLSTVKNADKIIMLSNGKILCVDTFDNLVRDEAQFAHMVELAKL